MKNVRAVVFPSITVAFLMLFWWGGVAKFDISPVLLPPPDVVMERLWQSLRNWEMQPHVLATLHASAIGYVVGCGMAVLTAIVLVELPLLDRMLYPMILGFQSMPKVAIAPLILIWLGYGMAGQVTLVALICFFPPFVNAFNALRKIDPNLVDLYRALSAGRLRIILQVKLPGAARSIFAGLQIGVLFALIGCVVMEFITGMEGIGFVILNSANSLDTPLSMAAMIVLSVLGVLLTQSVKWVQNKIVYWE